MFESLVASLLNRYLSDYIDEVDYNNLKLGIFSGTLELLNIKVKPSAMYQFDLPVDVKGGTIGKLKINISWRNILTKPAVAVLEDLFVLLGPFEDKIDDPARVEELSMVHKRKQLQEFDKLDSRDLVESKEKGYADKVQDTIINNIQVYVKNVHIRYEDKHSLKDKSISFGLYLKEFKAETVDEDNQPNFMNADAKIIYKLGSLAGFNMYWNCESGQPKNLLISSIDQFNPLNNIWINLMKTSIESNKILDSQFFLDTNLNLSTRVTIRRSYERNDSALPRITIQSSTPAIEFVFHRLQYKSILQIVDHYSMLNLHKKYVKYRPVDLRKEKNSKEKSRALWRFAFTAYAETTWRQFRKDRMLGHFKNYKLYMKKYEEKLLVEQAGKELDKKKLDQLEKLERDLVLESIFDIRSMLINKLRPNDTSNNNDKEQNTDIYNRPLNYVQFRLILNFPLISLSLINSQYEIICLKLKSIISRFDLKPIQNSVYFLLNTQGLELNGVHYTDKIDSKKTNRSMVPIVKSSHDYKNLDVPATYLASENAQDMLLVFCFETNPVKYENAEFSIRTRIASLEVYYEKTPLSELLRFFKTDLVDFGEVRKIKEVWSKAGVIYAVENHKQFHIIAELASPYFIIPAKGTCTQPSDAIVFFLGKTLIQSRVQPKMNNYTPESVQDLEKNFYDKLSMNVKEVQVLLVPPNLDWKSYFNNYKQLNYCYHLLYPITTKNYLYLSINPSYKKLPKMKLEAECSSIRLNFSNQKIISLYEFVTNFPLPEIPKTNSQTTQMSFNASSSKRTAGTGVLDAKNRPDSSNMVMPMGQSEVEPDDEWDGPFNLPMYINGDPIPNYSQISCWFTISDFTLDLNQNQNEYLNFVFKSIKIDFVVAKHGIFLRSGLEDLKLIDKLHQSLSEPQPQPQLQQQPQPEQQQKTYTEILSSSSKQNSNQIIKFYFRQIDTEAPNFSTLYSKIITNILFDCSNIHVKCHRTAIVYFVDFFKSTIEQIERQQDTSQVNAKNDQQAAKTIQHNHQQQDEGKKVMDIDKIPQDACQFNLVAKMNKLTWNMFDTQVKFGDMIVKQLSVGYNIKNRRTNLQIQLNKILVNYDNQNEKINTMYKQIISCTGDKVSGKFFDFSVTLCDKTNVNKNRLDDNCVDEIRLNVGKIKVVCLIKFVNELVEFIDPIINPLPTTLTDQVKEQAFEAVKHAYEETKSDTQNKLYLNVFITSPQVIIPRNSKSLSAFIADLGTVKLTNRFVDDLSSNTIQCIDLHLSNLEINRVEFKDTNNFTCDLLEQVIKPISLTSLIQMPINNTQPDQYADMDISASLKQVEFMVSLNTAQLLFAILAENLNEGMTNTNKDKNLTPVKRQIANNRKDYLDDNSRPTSARSELSTSDRITLKINFDLNEIKLIIVDFELKATNGHRFNSIASSKEDSSDFNSAKSTTQLSNANLSNQALSNNRPIITYFSHFEIQTICFSYFKSENSAWKANINMRSLVLNDVRPDSNLAVKEMFVSSKEQDFLKISYRFKPPGNARLDFFLDNLKINLCLPYVLKIYNFAMDAINASNKTETRSDSFDKKDTNPILDPDQTSVGTDLSLNVYGQISLKEVVLFAQPEKINSQILLMEAEIVLKFNSINSASNLEIDLTNLSLRLGEHNLKRQGIPFLIPCSAKVTMQQTDPKKPARYLAQIDSLFFNMTQTLYEVVMGVVTSINQTGTEQVKKIAQEEEMFEITEPFVKRPIDPTSFDIKVKTSNETENKSTVIDYLKNSMVKVTEILDLKVGQAFITFCEETSLSLQPLAIFKIQLEGQVANWSKNLHTKASLTLEASYYNDILSNWEPLIEHNMQQENNYRPWILSIWFALEPGSIVQPSIEVKGVPTIEFPVKDLDYSEVESQVQQRAIDIESLSENLDIGVSKKSGIFKKKRKDLVKNEKIESRHFVQMEEIKFEQNNASYILVESNDLLNINITPSAYKVCMYLASITNGSEREFMEGGVKAPLKFLNFLGEECELILNKNQLVKDQDAIGFKLKYDLNSRIESFMSDEPNKQIEKIMLNSQRSQIDTMYNENYKFVFGFPNYEKCRFSIKNDGSFLFPLRVKKNSLNHDSPLDQENIKYNVMYKVRTLYGRQKIIFSSPLQIENYTQINLLVWVELTNVLSQYKSKFNFIDQMTHGQKTYAALFLLVPNKVYYVPLYIAYNCKIFVSPDNKLFSPSQIFDLRGYNLRVEDYSQIVCHSLSNQQDFNLLRKLSLNVKSHRNVMPAMHANYRVLLYTTIRLVNSLPFMIRVDIDQDKKVLFNPILEPGDILNLNLDPKNISAIRIHLLNYLNSSWYGKLDIAHLVQFKDEVYKIKMNLSPTREMLVTGKNLNICVTHNNPNEFVIYSPYWLINKSGLPIKIRTIDDLRTFKISDDSILLFDFHYVSKDNKVRLTIRDGSWSKPFSFETVGTTGMIQCVHGNQTYNFLMRTTMSNSSRTKLITFAPFLTVANNLDEVVWIQEWHGHEKKIFKHNWIRVDTTDEENKPVGLWPKLVGESKQVKFVLKTADGRITEPFMLENPARFVLIPSELKNSHEEMHHQNSFIESNAKILTVLISGGNHNPVTIVIRKYQYGDAVAKFLNLCDDLSISIINNSLLWNIEPFTSMFFVWPDLANRILQWTVKNCQNQNEVLNLTKSGTVTHTFSVEKTENSAVSNYTENEPIDLEAESNLIKSEQNLNKQKLVEICCVSYLDDGQRVIVFTTDQSLAEIVQKKEASNLELFVNIRGLQLSIINNVNLEISTLYIRDSYSSWEIHNEDHVRVFTKEYSTWLELLYSNYLFNVHSVESIKQKCLLDANDLQTAEYQSEKFNFNFKKMLIFKPEAGHLVRHYHPGLIFQYRASANMTSIKCCIYKVQVENQLPDAYFPIVLHKTPMKLTNDSVQLIPFVSLSIFKELQNVTEIYRYFECILQELYLKVDKGFLLSMKDWYEASTSVSAIDEMTFNLSIENNTQVDDALILIDEDKSVQEKLKLDIKLSKEIMEYTNPTGSIKHSAHIRFEEFFLSPMLFNLSFSMNGKAHTDDKIRTNVSSPGDYLFNFFLESIGTSLTEFKDVKFSFNQFEMTNEIKTWNEIYDNLFDNYKVQALRQAYVLILGLDVLGNPFGLVSDFSEGFTSIFYDPLVDYLSGRNRADKVDVKLSTKLKLALNKSVSSAAGSGSLITGTVGRVLATFSFDRKYKKKRQYKISKMSTSSLSNTVSNASKGIVQGIVYGITGLVQNPIEEKRRGPKGFIVGIGKGLAGFVSKPVGSMFDGVSLTLDGLKRFALSGSEPIANIRLPRHLINDVSILPYSGYQARGYEILRDLQNDDIALDESYWAHLFIQNKRSRSLLFITDANIFRLKKTTTQIFKQWTLVQDPISLHKITLSKIVPFEMPPSLTKKKRNALEFCLNAKSFKEPDLYQLYISFNKEIENYDLNEDKSKLLLLIGEKRVCEWLVEKINSATKYYKELKNYIEII